MTNVSVLFDKGDRRQRRCEIEASLTGRDEYHTWYYKLLLSGTYQGPGQCYLSHFSRNKQPPGKDIIDNQHACRNRHLCFTCV